MVVFVDHETSAYPHLLPGDAVETTLLKKNDVLQPLNYPSSNGLLLSPPSSPETPDFAVVDRHKESSNQVSSNADSNLNVDHGFSAALSCYPVANQIARSIDLNTLHALSRTCRQFRVNLMQFRNQLIRETLRCQNELQENGSPEDNEGISAGMNGAALSSVSLTSRGSRCARDMVGKCQRCARVACRNCTMKLPTPTQFKDRLRRLCHTCLEVPLSSHLFWNLPDETGHNAAQLYEPWVGQCACETEVWLCKPCGQTLRSEDTSYKRVWSWRSRYSGGYLGGGLGIGIVECQGVTCGRKNGCLAAEDIEVEIDCEVDEHSEQSGATHNHHNHHHPHHHPHSHSHAHGHGGHSDHRHLEGRDEEEPGYLRQEIEGIGGVVKQKVKKRVRVGANVEEVGRERATEMYLKPEASGDVRSWCSWCLRVMPSNSEMAVQ